MFKIFSGIAGWLKRWDRRRSWRCLSLMVLLLAWPAAGAIKHLGTSQSATSERPAAVTQPKMVPAPLQQIKTTPATTKPRAASSATTKCARPVEHAVGGDGLGAPRGDHTHQGYDLIADLVEPVHAVLDGVVIQSGINPGKAGTLTKIKSIDASHKSVVLWYHHMITFTLLEKGDHVSKGQIIGLVGREGDSSGPHLHFEVHFSTDRSVGKTQDPVAWLKQCGVTYKRVPHKGT